MKERGAGKRLFGQNEGYKGGRVQPSETAPATCLIKPGLSETLCSCGLKQLAPATTESEPWR